MINSNIKMEEEQKTISISLKLFNIISDRIRNSGTEFSSVEEYVDYVLTELLTSKDDVSPYSEDEEKKIEKHLKDMGYI